MEERKTFLPFYLFFFCLLVTSNSFSAATVSHVSITQFYTYECVGVPLYVKRPFNFFRRACKQTVKWLDLLSFLWSHYHTVLPSKWSANKVCSALFPNWTETRNMDSALSLSLSLESDLVLRYKRPESHRYISKLIVLGFSKCK